MSEVGHGGLSEYKDQFNVKREKDAQVLLEQGELGPKLQGATIQDVSVDESRITLTCKAKDDRILRFIIATPFIVSGERPGLIQNAPAGKGQRFEIDNG